MNEPHDQARLAYVAMAALAGSITALSFLPWKTMTWVEILLTLFVGFAFAIFGMPWLAADWARIDIDNLRVICGITYFGATGANIFIPLVIRKLKRQLNLEGGA